MELVVDVPTRHRARARNGRAVSFADKVQVKPVEKPPRERKSELWFTASEIDSFQERTNLLRDITSGMTREQYEGLNVEDTCVFLGLETFLIHETSREEIAAHRRAVTDAVRFEQWRQLNRGVSDPTRIARVCDRMTKRCRRSARIIGLIQSA